MKKKEADGHTTKHAKSKKTKHEDTKKHHTTVHHKSPEASGHHVTTKAKHSTHAKARSLSPGDAGCCTPEALAMSARLQGFRVSDGDVLDLLWLAGGDPDSGVPIAGALEAARRYGLGGVRPASFGIACSMSHDVGMRQLTPTFVHGISPLSQPRLTVRSSTLSSAAVSGTERNSLDLSMACGDSEFCCMTADDDGISTPTQGHGTSRPGFSHVRTPEFSGDATSLILGVELPGPHTLLATPDGWWSWGEPFDPSEWPRMVIEEAWAVEWVTAA